jgi:serine/threonine-protein kinase RsbW
MRIDMEICLPRDALTLPVIRHIAMCALDELGVSPAAVDDVALALTEACTNVVKHSGVDDEYEVHLVVSDDVCEISVVDTGRGFDSSVLTQGMAPGSAEEGRGLALLSALVDGVSFESRPEEGTVVHLVKQLDLEGDAPLRRLLGSTAERGDGHQPLTGT